MVFYYKISKYSVLYTGFHILGEKIHFIYGLLLQLMRFLIKKIKMARVDIQRNNYLSSLIMKVNSFFVNIKLLGRSFKNVEISYVGISVSTVKRR